MTPEQATIQALHDKLFIAEQQIESANLRWERLSESYAYLGNKYQALQRLLKRKKTTVKNTGLANAVTDVALPEGISLDTRPCPYFNQTRFRRLHFGEAYPCELMSCLFDVWLYYFHANYVGQLYEPKNHICIVPIDHPITPYKP